MPEPLAENLVGLAEKVKEVNADIGFAQDPDADRLVLCNENGEIIFEEYTLALSVKSVLDKTPGDIVVNLSSSNTNEDLVTRVGHKIYRTKVGEGNVVEGILAHNAVIGGEGSGGVIYPKMNLCRDSLVGIALVLELLAREGKPISEIVSELPRYELVKTKMPFSGVLAGIIEKVISSLPGGKSNTEDGLRIDFADRSWVQIRESNTEPIVRIWAEAKTRERAEELVEKTKGCINN
jgi:phosphomannomutase